MDVTFIFIAYTVGTLFGLYVGNKVATMKIVEHTIDDLIAKKYIRTRMNKGETELLQYDEN